MGTTTVSGPMVSQAGFNDSGQGFRDGHPSGAGGVATFVKNVRVPVVDGAAALTYDLPPGVFTQHTYLDTPTAIPGTPTNVNVRIGSAANGQQYVADVDAKAAGVIPATLTAAARRPTGATVATHHVTVASSGGTAGLQDGDIFIRHVYSYL